MNPSEHAFSTDRTQVWKDLYQPDVSGRLFDADPPNSVYKSTAVHYPHIGEYETTKPPFPLGDNIKWIYPGISGSAFYRRIPEALNTDSGRVVDMTRPSYQIGFNSSIAKDLMFSLRESHPSTRRNIASVLVYPGTSLAILSDLPELVRPTYLTVLEPQGDIAETIEFITGFSETVTDLGVLLTGEHDSSQITSLLPEISRFRYSNPSATLEDMSGIAEKSGHLTHLSLHSHFQQKKLDKILTELKKTRESPLEYLQLSDIIIPDGDYDVRDLFELSYGVYVQIFGAKRVLLDTNDMPHPEVRLHAGIVWVTPDVETSWRLQGRDYFTNKDAPHVFADESELFSNDELDIMQMLILGEEKTDWVENSRFMKPEGNHWQGYYNPKRFRTTVSLYCPINIVNISGE